MFAGELSPSILWPTPIHNICSPGFLKKRMEQKRDRAAVDRAGCTGVIASSSPLLVEIWRGQDLLGVVHLPEYTVMPRPQEPQRIVVQQEDVQEGFLFRDFDAMPVMLMTTDAATLLVFNGSFYMPLHIHPHESALAVYNYARFTWTYSHLLTQPNISFDS